MNKFENLISDYQITGSEDSFNEVYEEFAPKAFAVAKRRAIDMGLSVEDVESEANSAILKAIKTYDLKGGFEPYLTKVVKFYSTNVGRTTKRQLNRDQYAVLQEESPYGNPEENAIKKEQRQLLELMSANADDKSRQALQAFAISESYREAAKLLDINHETVKNRIEKLSATTQNISLSDYLTA